MFSHKVLQGIRPSFYDVLSGEFLPPTDRLNRVHKLGRLGTSAMQKGEWHPRTFLEGLATPRKLGNHPITTFSYVPSWAPVSVTAAIERQFLEGLQIRSDDESEGLAVYDITTEDNSSVWLHHDGATTEMPANSGPELDEAQVVIAKAAQEFFDNLHIR